MNEYLTLSRRENQALGLGRYALDFIRGTSVAPAESTLVKVEQFHLDSVGCAVAALGCRANAPQILRNEALDYPPPAGATGALCFGSRHTVQPEKAVAANCSAVRELDAPSAPRDAEDLAVAVVLGVPGAAPYEHVHPRSKRYAAARFLSNRRFSVNPSVGSSESGRWT